MVRLPVVSGQRVVAALRRAGFSMVRQRGSHVSMEAVREGRTYRTVVPLHDELAKGTLRDILSQTGLTKDEPVKFLR
jgi:predicted RNA binding protein YcfA (HicA-like mRNA interferase family)